MTVNEFSNEFDLLYDNASMSAPGLDLYEKSVFLTQAQEVIVKEAYSGYTASGVSFEGSEKRRRQLSELVRDYKKYTQLDLAGTTAGYARGVDTGVPYTGQDRLVSSSQMFQLPNDLMYILHETITISDPSDPSLNQKIIDVVPITHDEYNVKKNNPFQKPNKRKAWRLDLFMDGANMKVEILAINIIDMYHCRYIKVPTPIILTNFETDPDLTGLNLTIGGSNTSSTSELNPEIHRDILLRGVDLAVLAARENSLQNRTNTNKSIV
tara:strand:+ start:1999 stop:2799 length:801 start_codon:yes stop_codon:yes gene_type:complete